MVLGARFRHRERAAEAAAHRVWFTAAGYPVVEPEFVNEGEGDLLAVGDVVLGLLIGAAVLAAVVVIAAGLDLRHAGPALDVGGGLLAGAFTMSTGVNGPPMVFVLQARHFSPDRFRATITTVFATLDIVSIVVFAITGELRSTALAAIAVALPGLVVGAVAGLWLRRHLDRVRFRRLVLGLLTVAGVSAVISALT
jgi:uncharacterized membrane protein YfcA